MFYLCSQVHGYSSLNISWDSAMKISVAHRDWLVNKLREIRDKEEREMKQATRGIG